MPLKQQLGLNLFTMLSFDEKTASLTDTLLMIEQLYQVAQNKVNHGEQFAPRDIPRIEKLRYAPTELRDLEIIHTDREISNYKVGKKWGVSYARVSQIRTDGLARIFRMFRTP